MLQTWRRDRKEREEAWRNRVSADAMRIASLEKEVASSNAKLHAGTRGAYKSRACTCLPVAHSLP